MLMGANDSHPNSVSMTSRLKYVLVNGAMRTAIGIGTDALAELSGTALARKVIPVFIILGLSRRVDV
jgi:hypothetical protein